ncbi:MAG: hypothetical protein KDN18_11445 [Verrucomicrobiae bacterium]|nr:hypothetical protein [Verrucomicrobiae bacterium]
MNWRAIGVWMGLLSIHSGLLAEVPPDAKFFASGTVEYRPGNLPLVIAAPHGGRLVPAEIPDRVEGVLTRDAETDLLAIEVAEAIYRRTGLRPHLVLCHLHRRKVDCNRDALVGTGGNPRALETWRAFHDIIDEARTAAGRGLFLDLHGHSHPEARVEIGYLLDAKQLREEGADFNALAQVSSVASLAGTSPVSFEELIRGKSSLGALLHGGGFPAVPSPEFPDPGEEPFFRGGYNTARYRTGGTGDAFFSLQIECPKPGVRDTEENRRRFAKALATSLEAWLLRHAGIRLVNEEARPESRGSE